jgi:hypothetical protein
MPQSFSCPSCGGILEHSGHDAHISCPYCGNTLAVPTELWQPSQQAKTAEDVSRYARYLLIFIAIVVGVPTCLGLIGTLLGLGGAIVGVIVAVLAPLLPFLFR